MTKTFLFSLIALIFCVLYTTDTRINTFNGDIDAYLHAADTLREGHGLRNEDDTPFTLWPFLYPTVLALFGGGLETTRSLNILCLWSTLTLSYILMRRYSVPAWAALMICLLFLGTITDGQLMFQTALSESLYLPLWLTWLIVLPMRGYRALVLSAILIGLCAVTRYIGVPFVIVGAVYIMRRDGLFRGIVWAVIAGCPIGLWMLRNLALTGHITGHSMMGDYTLISLMMILNLLLRWMLLVGLLYWLDRLCGRLLRPTVSASFYRAS